MVQSRRDRPHFHLQGAGQAEPYTSKNRGFSGLPPAKARAAHAARLEKSLAAAVASAQARLQQRDATLAEGDKGFYLDFTVPAEHQAALDGLEHRPKGVELVAVKPVGEDGAAVQATVFVPLAQAGFFATKIEEYRDKDTKHGHPKNQNLVARLDDVHLADVRSLFTDDPELYPKQPKMPVWWEIWLRDGHVDPFRRVADRLGVLIQDQVVYFPERAVVLARADVATLARLILHSDAVAELRAAKDTPSFFLDMPPVEQGAWVRNLAARLKPAPLLAPVVCVLDSGASQGHPLLSPGLDVADQHAVDDTWGKGDSARYLGHGTKMAGVALLGHLDAQLAGSQPLALSHRLETVKILPPVSHNDPLLYGAVTALAINKAETKAPRRSRVFCMAVTSSLGLGRGRPSSWSAAIDQLCYGAGDHHRLMVLSAGNIRNEIAPSEYLDANDLAEVENPGQAWNPLVVGAYTQKTTISHPDYAGWSPIAPAGDLSPTSRTSTVWDRQWPVRPDIVFEGGNLAHDGANPGESVNDLLLVTTYYQPAVRLLTAFGETSAAAALAAHFAASLMARRPELWPETVRALIVHAAEWTPAMRAWFDATDTQSGKAALLRRYGWGVPDLGRALYSTHDDATIIVEDVLLPFRRDGSDIKTRDMHLHGLPWPREELLALGEQDVELRVTLSYFVEPNPGERGWTRRHRYASHSLRFSVKRAYEELQQFRQRINRAAEAEEGDQPSPPGGDNWLLGSSRDRGSIHSDVWRGSAADLAERDAIGVYPVSGWWKEKPGLKRWDRAVRYALVVSIRASGSSVDLYSAIENKIAISVQAK